MVPLVKFIFASTGCGRHRVESTLNRTQLRAACIYLQWSLQTLNSSGCCGSLGGGHHREFLADRWLRLARSAARHSYDAALVVCNESGASKSPCRLSSSRRKKKEFSALVLHSRCCRAVAAAPRHAHRHSEASHQEGGKASCSREEGVNDRCCFACTLSLFLTRPSKHYNS